MKRYSASRFSGALRLALSVALLTSCGAEESSSSDGGGAASSSIAGSCNNEPSGFCVEYTGAEYQAPRVQKTCEAQKNTFLAGACPAAGRVGSCLVYAGKHSEARYRYYTGFPGFGVTPPQGVAVAAEEQCRDLKGEWEPS